MMPNDTTFNGEIKVASRIVDHLSSGIYKSPAACLKELVNNAYDADAKTVRVFVKPDADRILIEDDGRGMSKAEFRRHFDRVAESHKRDESETTESGRPKIGLIGIGFIAANEVCEELEIFSTKEGSTNLLHVTINFKMMKQDPAERARKGGDFAKADYVGELLSADTSDHYTTLVLKNVRGEARNLFAGATARRSAGSLYGKSPESVTRILADGGLRSWTDLDEYSRTMLRVGLNVPVAYAPSWAPKGLLESYLGEFSRMTEALSFRVEYDGTDLRKPIVLRPGHRRTLVRLFEFAGKDVSARGYFYAQHGRIEPEELQGLLMRIRHAAVGEYDQTFWGFPATEGTLFKTWTSAEIWADDRLEAAMNIDRSTLRDVHPAYVELRTAIHGFLSDFLKDVRDKLYGAGAEERKVKRATNELAKIKKVARERTTSVPETGRNLSRAWDTEAKKEGASRKLTRKYSVSELYAVVLEVAEETLPRQLLAEFVKRLTDRLRG